MRIVRKSPLCYLAHLRNLAAICATIESGDEPDSYDLARTVGVDRRTVMRYLATLRDEFAAPIAAGPRGGYRFAKPWTFAEAVATWLEK